MSPGQHITKKSSDDESVIYYPVRSSAYMNNARMAVSSLSSFGFIVYVIGCMSLSAALCKMVMQLTKSAMCG